MRQLAEPEDISLPSFTNPILISPLIHTPDASLALVLERTVDVPRELVWDAMKSPEGEEYPGDGCILEVVPHSRFVFTDALSPSS